MTDSGQAHRQEARRLIAVALGTGKRAQDRETFEKALHMLDSACSVDPGFYEPHYHLACGLEALASFEQARDHFLMAMHRDRSFGGQEEVANHAYTRLGDLYAMLGQPDEAVRYYNRYLGLYPLSAGATGFAFKLSLLAECGGDWFGIFVSACELHHQGQHPQAIDRLLEAAQCYPACAAIYFVLGLSYRALGRNEEAIRALDYAFSLDADPRILVESGIAYGDMGNAYVEENCFAKALEMNPLDATAGYHLGAVLYARRDRDHALDVLQQAVQLDPEASWVDQARELLNDLLKGGQVDYPACLIEPVQWTMWKDEDRGIEIPYPSGAQVRPSDLLSVSDPGGVFTFTLKARLLSDNSDEVAIIRMLEKSLVNKPNLKVESRQKLSVGPLTAYMTEITNTQTDAVRLEMLVFRDRETWEMGCDCPWFVYRRARPALVQMMQKSRWLTSTELHQSHRLRYAAQVAQNPKDTEALGALAAAMVGLDDLVEAGKVYSQILQIDPNNFKALGDLGEVYLKVNKLDLAIKSLEKSLSIRPQAEYFKILGLAFEKKGQPDRAVRSFQKGLEMQPVDSSMRMLLGASYDSLKKYDLAEKEFRQILATDPRNVRVRVLMGTSFRRQKRHDDALSLLKECSDIDPGNFDVGLLLAACYMDLQYWDMAEKALRNLQRLDYGNQAVKDALDDLAVRRKSSRRY